MDTYLIDPASTALHGGAAFVIVFSTSVASAWLVGRMGRRAWWPVLLVAVILPTPIAALFGGSLPGAAWPLMAFLIDVTMPLALLGLASAMLGSGVGALVRRRLSAPR